MVLKPWQSFPLLLAGCYLVFCLTVILWQRRLLYFPQPLTPAAADAAFALYGVERWPEGSGAAYRGLVKKTSGAHAFTNGTVLVFHGNAGGAHDRIDYCLTLQRHGWRVILAEYPGYGARGGRINETSFREDARATARLARQQEPGRRLIVFGESLGCGVAAAVASDLELRVDALVLATPWDKLESVAAARYPWLPVRFFLRDRYDSAAALAAYSGPVTILMAGDDEIIPARSTLRLYEAMRHALPRRLIRIPDVGHNDWFDILTDAQWREILSPP